jgi:subtilisin family serine protease
VYTHVLQGYSARLDKQALAAVKADPNVDYVEQDRVVGLDTTQTGATWGLDRIDQRGLPLNGTSNYNAAGAGVKAYIIDTGIRFSHSQFGGRAISGYDAVDGGTADDCNGHGTHVSGTVGGSTYGVAKQVTLVGVRVLNCSGSGSNSGVIAGINWVTSDHQAGRRRWPT